MGRSLFCYSISTLEPPPWIPSNAVTACMKCKDIFTLQWHRHHCRNCGHVICERCSSKFIPLPEFGFDKPARVCDPCHAIIEKSSGQPADFYGSSVR